MEKALDDNERGSQPVRGTGAGTGIPGMHVRFACKSKILNHDIQDDAGGKDCDVEGKASLRKELRGNDVEKVWLTIAL